MKHILSCLVWEVRVQFRSGFYLAVGVVLAVWVVLALQFPRGSFAAVVPGLLLANLEITAFYFMAGLVMLEKDQGTLEAWTVTPLSSGEYLAVKVIALGLLAVLENLAVAVVLVQGGMNLLPMCLGLLMGAAVFVLVGFLAVVRYDSINEFMLPSMLYTVLIMLPLVDYFGLWRSPLFYLHPMQAALVLLRGGFEVLAPWEWAYGVLYLFLGCAVLFYLSRRAFTQFVTARQGVH
jgi:fluoroquinolone transport system permease protein